jgi:hypothetical protein
MTDIAGRRAFVALAAGAAVAAGAIPASAAASSAAPSEADLKAARAAAAVVVPAPERRPDAVVAEASVRLCRSWDSSVYLYVNDRVKGLVALNPAAFALAAAAQAADRRIAVRYWGHEREWAGVGRFQGVLLAMDLRDLPYDGSSPA